MNDISILNDILNKELTIDDKVNFITSNKIFNIKITKNINKLIQSLKLLDDIFIEEFNYLMTENGYVTISLLSLLIILNERELYDKLIDTYNSGDNIATLDIIETGSDHSIFNYIYLYLVKWLEKPKIIKMNKTILYSRLYIQNLNTYIYFYKEWFRLIPETFNSCINTSRYNRYAEYNKYTVKRCNVDRIDISKINSKIIEELTFYYSIVDIANILDCDVKDISLRNAVKHNDIKQFKKIINMLDITKVSSGFYRHIYGYGERSLFFTKILFDEVIDKLDDDNKEYIIISNLLTESSKRNYTYDDNNVLPYIYILNKIVDRYFRYKHSNKKFSQYYNKIMDNASYNISIVDGIDEKLLNSYTIILNYLPMELVEEMYSSHASYSDIIFTIMTPNLLEKFLECDCEYLINKIYAVFLDYILSHVKCTNESENMFSFDNDLYSLARGLNLNGTEEDDFLDHISDELIKIYQVIKTKYGLRDVSFYDIINSVLHEKNAYLYTPTNSYDNNILNMYKINPYVVKYLIKKGFDVENFIGYDNIGYSVFMC